ncbi:MAG TPA: RNA methyltransferase [Burkholderiaceae bacterium]|nr:RNA methyltransferase [Burkholderiaceae bacterium]
MAAKLRHVSSRANPLVKALRRLAHEPGAYRKLGRVWLEGDHLCRALLARRLVPEEAVVTEAGWTDAAMRRIAEQAPNVTVVDEASMRDISGLESPAALGFVFTPTAHDAPLKGVPTVVLDGLQDAGNVGSVLRSAAALGVTQVIALKGTAALWSPKVLRAGMGAHFGLRLIESASAALLDQLEVPLVATSSHAGQDLHEQSLPQPCAWVLGHEGQGVHAALLQRCDLTVRIPQPGGEESLNVAAAAAICLYESVRQRNQ